MSTQDFLKNVIWFLLRGIEGRKGWMEEGRKDREKDMHRYIETIEKIIYRNDFASLLNISIWDSMLACL